ncbi:1-deoxy-D-xylulose 5-phosphate reductoisomerase [compost metagenome]
MLRKGCAASVTLNAANEAAVDAFLNGRLRYTDIACVVEDCLQQAPTSAHENLDDILAADAQARVLAGQAIQRAASRSPSPEVAPSASVALAEGMGARL